MKKYTLDGMKYGTDPDFWKWFYLGNYRMNYFLNISEQLGKDFLNKLQEDLIVLSRPENLEWANKKDDSDKWIIKHSKESLLAQIKGLKKAIDELKTEELK